MDMTDKISAQKPEQPQMGASPHQGRKAYFDCAATVPMCPAAIDEYVFMAKNYWGNASSGHLEGADAWSQYDYARNEVAKVFCCRPEQVFFTSGATEGANWSIDSAVRAACLDNASAHPDGYKPKVWVLPVEHECVLKPLEALALNHKIELTYGEVDRFSRMKSQTIPDLEAIADKNDIVVMMAVNNETGVIYPVSMMSAVIESKKPQKRVYLISDITQAVGKVPSLVDDPSLYYVECEGTVRGPDYMFFSAHKVGGPKGCGVLITSEHAPLFPFIFGGAQQDGVRGGTVDVPSICATATAVLFNVGRSDSKEGIYKFMQEQSCYDRIVSGLPRKAILNSPVILNQYVCDAIPSIINIDMSKVAPSVSNWVGELDAKGISVSGGAACSSTNSAPSHVLMAMGLTEKEARGSIRVSFDEHTTWDDVDKLLEAIKEIVKEHKHHNLKKNGQKGRGGNDNGQ
jgi:cysteine desulfurase